MAARPSFWKAWIVSAIFVTPFAWLIIASTHIPALVVIAIALALTISLAKNIHERVKRKYPPTA